VHFTFRRLTEADLPRLHDWLEQPHVRAFWRDEPRTLDGVAERYAGVLAGTEPTYAFIASLEELPIGFLQTYRIADHPDYAARIDVGADAAGVDMLIGDPSFAHRGLGAPLLVQFVDEVVWPVTCARACWIGPTVDNTRAIRCYQKAGFEHVKTVLVPGDDQPEYLMRLVPSSTGG
jgi:aminoglycoside 6'-N-acetyltransferase